MPQSLPTDNLNLALAVDRAHAYVKEHGLTDIAIELSMRMIIGSKIPCDQAEQASQLLGSPNLALAVDRAHANVKEHGLTELADELRTNIDNVIARRTNLSQCHLDTAQPR